MHSCHLRLRLRRAASSAVPNRFQSQKMNAPIDNELLAILRCPETLQKLSEAPVETVRRVESERLAGRLRGRAGSAIGAPIEAGLVREDGKVFFPIRDGIPVMLVDEAIGLDEAAGSPIRL